MASSASLKALEGDWQYTSEKVIYQNKVNSFIVYSNQIKVQYITTQLTINVHVNDERKGKSCVMLKGPGPSEADCQADGGAGVDGGLHDTQG